MTISECVQRSPGRHPSGLPLTALARGYIEPERRQRTALCGSSIKEDIRNNIASPNACLWEACRSLNQEQKEGPKPNLLRTTNKYLYSMRLKALWASKEITISGEGCLLGK